MEDNKNQSEASKSSSEPVTTAPPSVTDQSETPLITLTIKTPKDKETVNVKHDATIKEVLNYFLFLSLFIKIRVYIVER